MCPLSMKEIEQYGELPLQRDNGSMSSFFVNEKTEEKLKTLKFQQSEKPYQL